MNLLRTCGSFLSTHILCHVNIYLITHRLIINREGVTLSYNVLGCIVVVECKSIINSIPCYIQ